MLVEIGRHALEGARAVEHARRQPEAMGARADDRVVALEPFAVEEGEGLRPGGHGRFDPSGRVDDRKRAGWGVVGGSLDHDSNWLKRRRHREEPAGRRGDPEAAAAFLRPSDRRLATARRRRASYDAPWLLAMTAPGHSSSMTSAAPELKLAAASPTRTPAMIRSGAISARGARTKARLKSSGWGSVSFSLLSEMSS